LLPIRKKKMLGKDCNKLIIDFYRENTLLAMGSIGSHLTGLIIDSIFVPRIMSKLFLNINDPQEVNRNMQKLVLAWIISEVSYTINESINISFEPTLNSFITNKFMRALLLKYQVLHEEINTSLIISKINRVKSNIDTIIHRITLVCIPRSITLMLMIRSFYQMNKKIGYVTLVCVIVQIFLICKSYDVESKDRIVMQLNFADSLLEELDDKFTNIETISSVRDGIKKEIVECKRLTDLVKNVSINSDSYLLHKHVNSHGINTLLFIILLNTAYTEFVNKRLSNEDLTNILVSINGLYEQISAIEFFIPDLLKRITSINNSQEFIADLFKFSEYPFQDIPTVPTDHSSVIEFKNVTFKYKSKFILNKYNLRISPNDMICILGPSGCGKSTFTKLICSALKPTEGEILIFGKNNSIYDTKQFISYVPQNTNKLFNKTIFQNLIYGNGSGNNRELRQKIEHLFKTYNLQTVFSSINKIIDAKCNLAFLDYKVGKNGELLSGGQKQTIHIIRAFLSSTSRIIILDEPTTALDAVSKEYVFRLIEELNKEKTILIISHDNFIHQKVQKKLVLSYGANPVAQF
jgi:ABC-type multidrug transport system fused ATPase/permease subunit